MPSSEEDDSREMGEQTVPEQRRHPRFIAPDCAFAILKNHVCEVGQLINMSRGGLAFKYMADDPVPTGDYQLDIFLAGNAFKWQGIPHRTVLDIALDPEVPFSTIPMRRRGIAFQSLTEEHLSCLEHLLGLFRSPDSPEAPA